MALIKLSQIKPNPKNPRLIKDDKFTKLCNSIKEFPEMMALRPMIVNADNVLLGGNMRLKALEHLGYKEIPSEWIKQASDLTPDQQKRFIIADNVGFGEWEWDILNKDWKDINLNNWGLIPLNENDSIVDETNLNDEWIGMPDFEAGEIPYKIVINFKTELDREQFAKDIKLEIRKKEQLTWSTWYPFRDYEDLASLKHE